MRAIRTVERWLTRAEEAATVALLVFMVGMAFLQVVLRNVFSSPHLGWLQSILRAIGFSGGILWAEILLKNLVLWVGLLGAMLAASADKQFAMDVAHRVLSGRMKIVVASICNIFAAAVSGVLAWAALDFWRQEFEEHKPLFKIGSLGVQTWILDLILPGGFLLLAIHYLIKLFDPWVPEELRDASDLPDHLAGPSVKMTNSPSPDLR
jgi:TRAP-type C4-dicarboxylate transport system permease small subunit